jgi:hypothetical protein
MTDDATSPGGGSGSVVTVRVQQYLRETKPWVTFMSILVFVGAGFMIVAALVMLAIGAAGGAAARSAFGGAMIGGVVAVVYLLFALLYIMPGLFLWRYRNAIGRLGVDGSVGTLENALMHQRSFWRFVGILTLVGLGIALLSVVAVIIFGLAAAGSVMR